VGLGSETPCLERRKTVKDEMPATVELGDLIQAVVEEAVQHSTDPTEVARLATQAVAQVLWRYVFKQMGPRLAPGAN
jgi:hypothetical protein